MATDEIKQTIVIEASLTKIQQDLKQLEGNFKSSFANISSAANSALGALGVSLSGAAIVGFVKTSVSEIGKLQDAFERTGISADLLLKLRPILENTGSSVEEFANSVNAMQKSLVDGSAATIEAFKKVGIGANDLLKLAEDPEALLDRVAKGLANVATQTERVAIARELASRAGGRIAPALLELAKGGGVEGLNKKPSIITKEDIAAIDEAGDAFNTMFIKAEALAAKSFIQVLQGFKDVAAYIQEHPIKFIFNIDGGLFEIAGTARKIREEAAKAAAGSRIGGAASLVEGTAPGLKETNAQRDFNKALDDQIEGLRSQSLGLTSSKEAAIANAAEIIKTKAATIGLTDSSEELTKRLNEFKTVSLNIAQAQLADQLTKANQGIEIQIATMTQGKAAAEALALKYSLLDAKLQNIGPAAEEAAKRQKELNDELARAVVPDTLKELDESKIAAQKKQVTLGITFNADEAVRAAVQSAIEKLANEKDPRAQKLAFEAALKLKPELDAATFKSIKTELGLSLGLDKEFSQVLNQTFTNTLDVAGEKVRALENALQQARQRGVDPMSEGVQKLARDLDQAKFDQATSDLNRELTIATNESTVLGRTFNVGAAAVGAIETQLTRLISAGLDPANDKVRELTVQLRDAKVGSIFADLQKGLEDIQNEAAVLGGVADVPAESVDKLTDAIKRLIAEGIDPLDPKIQGLKAQLEDARAAEHFADAFQGIGNSFVDALTDLADGGKIKDVMKRLASNINRALTDALITRPLQDWIKSQTNDLFGGFLKPPSIPGTGAGQSVNIPGAAGQIGAAATQTQPAIAATALQTVAAQATTAIQTTSVTTQTSIEAISAQSTAGIEATLAVAETTITTLGATTEASIAAIQAAAIAAIEATSATQAVSSSGGSALSSIPLLGSLLSSSGSAAASGASGAVNLLEVGAAVHGGGLIAPNMVSKRFHQGGAINSAVNSVQLSKIAHFHAGGAIAPTINTIDLSRLVHLHEGGRVTQNASSESLSTQHSALRTFHIGGIIGPTITSNHLNNVMNATTMARFHDGGGMMGGKIGGDATLKPGERMIIAEDGEYVIKKQTAMKIGLKKLEQLNRDQAMITPKMHIGGIVVQHTGASLNPKYLQTFHQGGKILLNPHHSVLSTLSMPRFHDGGDISAWDRFSGTSTSIDLSSVAQAASIPQGMLMQAGGSKNGNGGPSTNNAVFINPQFQNRQSVGQTSAQLTAAMEAGKRNR